MSDQTYCVAWGDRAGIESYLYPGSEIVAETVLPQHAVYRAFFVIDCGDADMAADQAERLANGLVGNPAAYTREDAYLKLLAAVGGVGFSPYARTVAIKAAGSARILPWAELKERFGSDDPERIEVYQLRLLSSCSSISGAARALVQHEEDGDVGPYLLVDTLTGWRGVYADAAVASGAPPSEHSKAVAVGGAPEPRP